MIPYSTQDIDEKDIESIVNILKSDALTQGKTVELFEYTVCGKTNAHFGVAMNSATSALHAACRAIGITKGDTVWVSAISFAATANCARYCGADVEFIDIDENTFNMDVKLLWDKLLSEKDTNPPKAIIVTHMGGMPAEMAGIRMFADTIGAFIIEDASHALGATYLNTHIGSCAYSDITVFSFHPVKPITTGEGGMATTNNKNLADKMKLFRSHGIQKNPTENEPWHQDQTFLGMNYRLPEISAALGISQLRKLRPMIERRRQLSQRYWDELHDYGYSQPESIRKKSAHHLHIHCFPRSVRGNIYNKLAEAGYATQVHYKPIYLHSYYQNLKNYEPCEKAEEYYSEALSLPLHTKLTDDQQTEVIKIIKDNF